jgi:hypothetical protein
MTKDIVVANFDRKRITNRILGSFIFLTVATAITLGGILVHKAIKTHFQEKNAEAVMGLLQENNLYLAENSIKRLAAEKDLTPEQISQLNLKLERRENLNKLNFLFTQNKLNEAKVLIDSLESSGIFKSYSPAKYGPASERGNFQALAQRINDNLEDRLFERIGEARKLDTTDSKTRVYNDSDFVNLCQDYLKFYASGEHRKEVITNLIKYQYNQLIVKLDSINPKEGKYVEVMLEKLNRLKSNVKQYNQEVNSREMINSGLLRKKLMFFIDNYLRGTENYSRCKFKFVGVKSKTKSSNQIYLDNSPVEIEEELNRYFNANYLEERNFLLNKEGYWIDGGISYKPDGSIANSVVQFLGVKHKWSKDWKIGNRQLSNYDSKDGVVAFFLDDELEVASQVGKGGRLEFISAMDSLEGGLK